MFHNQIQQVQQRVDSLQNMVAQMRQAEQNNQQRLQQIAREEQNVIQQLTQVQQICQECLSTLQNVSYTQPQFTAGITQTPAYQGTAAQVNYSGAQFGGQGVLQTTSPLFDPATMGASTYQGTKQTFGQVPGMMGTGFGQAVQTGTQGIFGGAGGGVQFTTSPLSDPATMDPETYQASRQHLGASSTGLSQIGQQVGISGTSYSPVGTGAMGLGTGTMTMNMGSGSGLSSIATMGPDTYLASQQRLGGSSPSLSQIGQQAGISGFFGGSSF